jgi:hypothetical protein
VRSVAIGSTREARAEHDQLQAPRSRPRQAVAEQESYRSRGKSGAFQLTYKPTR